MLADSLCHEIIHAADKACDPRHLSWSPERRSKKKKTLPLEEPIFQDEMSAELGWSWTTFVTGGIIRKNVENVSAPITVHDWPLYLDVHPRLHHVVSMDYISRIQQQGFWDSVKPSDTKVLHITDADLARLED